MALSAQEHNDVAFARQTYLHHSACCAIEGRLEELRKVWLEMYGELPYVLPKTSAARRDYSRRMSMQLLKAFAKNLCIRQEMPAKSDGSPTYVWRSLRETNSSFEGLELRKPRNTAIAYDVDPQYLVHSGLTYSAADKRVYMTHCTAITTDLLREWDKDFDSYTVELPSTSVLPNRRLAPLPSLRKTYALPPRPFSLPSRPLSPPLMPSGSPPPPPPPSPP